MELLTLTTFTNLPLPNTSTFADTSARTPKQTTYQWHHPSRYPHSLTTHLHPWPPTRGTALTNRHILQENYANHGACMQVGQVIDSLIPSNHLNLPPDVLCHLLQISPVKQVFHDIEQDDCQLVQVLKQDPTSGTVYISTLLTVSVWRNLLISHQTCTFLPHLHYTRLPCWVQLSTQKKPSLDIRTPTGD